MRSESPISTLYEMALSGFPLTPRYCTLNRNLLLNRLLPPSIIEKMRDFMPGLSGRRPSTSTEISPCVTVDAS